MNINYWIRGFARIFEQLAKDFSTSNGRRFAFTQHLLRSGYIFDKRMKADSRHFLDIFPAAENLVVSLGDVRYTRSNANPFELFCLTAIAMLKEPKRVFEFGTFDGATTLQLAAAAPQAEILTLDLDPASVNAMQPATIDGEVANVRWGGVGQRFVGRPEAQRIRQLLGDSTSFDYTPYHGAIDLVFIDACHDYAFAKSDTVNALRMCPRGVIVWHDYYLGWPGVIQAVDELLADHRVMHIGGTSLAILDHSAA